jgi:hypothetical protein
MRHGPSFISITLFARTKKISGTVTPMALAVIMHYVEKIALHQQRLEGDYLLGYRLTSVVKFGYQTLPKTHRDATR